MKKVITAIGNKNVNEKLKIENNIQVIGTDIQHQEGILEILEKENEINFLIVSEKIIGELNIIQLIEKIKFKNKSIKIILILENKNEELENILISKGIYKIIYHNQVEIKDIINLINEEKDNKENEELKEEINNLKKLIMENDQIKNKNKNKLNNYLKNTNFYHKIKKKIEKLIPKSKIQKNSFNNQLFANQINSNQKEIISISGPSGVGKSIITVNLAKSLIYEKKKVLMIDFDILNNSLHTILGVKKYPTKIEKEIKNNSNNNVDKNKRTEFNVENFIININKRMDLVSVTNLLFGTKEKLNSFIIEKILNQLKEKYNTIIIDTSSECFFDITKNIIQLSNKSIFVTETNILEIKKAKELLNIYINEWKISKEKFNILFNKYDEECVDINLLKCIFCEFNILGVLKYHAKYNKLINKNIKNNFLDKKIREEYMKINQKI